MLRSNPLANKAALVADNNLSRRTVGRLSKALNESDKKLEKLLDMCNNRARNVTVISRNEELMLRKGLQYCAARDFRSTPMNCRF